MNRGIGAMPGGAHMFIPHEILAKNASGLALAQAGRTALTAHARSVRSGPEAMPVLSGRPSRPAEGPAVPGSLMRRLRDGCGALLRERDIVVDLAEDMGSARWFRGFGTMIALGLGAVAFWPDFAPLEAASPVDLRRSERDELRSQMILPLSLGADSGRRMGATPAVMALPSVPERPRIELQATLAQGDSFGRMLQRLGVGGADAGQVAELVSARVPLGSIAPGTRFEVVLGQKPAPGAARPLDSLRFRARFDLELALARQGGALVVDARPIDVNDSPLRIRGKVGSSLYRSARAAGAPPRAVQQYLRTLSERFQLDGDVAPGDDFDIILSFRRAATGETQEGELLYAGLERNGQARAQLLRWGADGQFLEASGAGEQRSGFVTPVNGRLTSGFGMRRHPLLGYVRMHAGIDFAAGYGTPIHAASDGVVSFAGRHGGHGNYVRLNHGAGYGTGYAHMSQIAVGPGMSVRAGQVIGYVGSTGLSTGPHLHYEVYRNGQVVNPASVQFIMRAQLAGEELQRFRARLAQLKSISPVGAETRLAQQASSRPPVPLS